MCEYGLNWDYCWTVGMTTINGHCIKGCKSMYPGGYPEDRDSMSFRKVDKYLLDYAA
jgi:hypothetical protein